VGLLVDGVWFDQWYDTKSTGGRFVRQVSMFRNWVTPDGAPGPTGAGGLRQNRAAITSTSRSRALGPTGRSSSASSNGSSR
jgi:glutathionyl-hydroquinone reductase